MSDKIKQKAQAVLFGLTVPQEVQESNSAMFKVEFGVVHHNCPTNQVSRAFPEVRFTSPGGFLVKPNVVEEVLVVNGATDEIVEAVLQFLGSTRGYDEYELLERTADRAFIRWRASCTPDKFCSQMVEKNRCFQIGMEVQHEGLEQWQVGCHTRAQAEQLLKDLEQLGDVRYGRIVDCSWEELVDASDGCRG